MHHCVRIHVRVRMISILMVSNSEQYTVSYSISIHKVSLLVAIFVGILCYGAPGDRRQSKLNKIVMRNLSVRITSLPPKLVQVVLQIISGLIDIVDQYYSADGRIRSLPPKHKNTPPRQHDPHGPAFIR